MPELPEVEVVRAGLARAVTGAQVIAVDVLDARALKRHVPRRRGSSFGGIEARPRLSGHGVTLTAEAGTERAADLERRLVGVKLGSPVRRGKFMWIPIDTRSATAAGAATTIADPSPAPEALLAHLGMSGQLLVRALDAADDKHVRIRIWIHHPDHGELRLDFSDQRLFGSLALDALVPTGDGAAGGFAGVEMLSWAESGGSALAATALGVGEAAALIPSQAIHIARDPLDPAFRDAEFLAKLRSRTTAVKRVLLDQAIVSGVGNIYADESLWRARLHPETPGNRVSALKARQLLGHVRDVFAQALAEGGTSFDAMYVNVNGESGYFSHSLNAYGQEGLPCPRCGKPIKRVVLGGRSAHFCARCQRRH